MMVGGFLCLMFAKWLTYYMLYNASYDAIDQTDVMIKLILVWYCLVDYNVLI